MIRRQKRPAGFVASAEASALHEAPGFTCLESQSATHALELRRLPPARRG